MNSFRILRHAIAVAVAAFSLSNPVSAADVDAGKTLFSQCAGCHMVGPDAQPRFGPILNNIVNQPAASLDGYDYSSAFKAKASEGLLWDEQSLNDFLKAPMAYVAGTKMAFPGVSSEADRLDIIAYLALFGADQNSSSDTDTAAVKPETAGTSTDDKTPRTLAKDTKIPTHGTLHLGRLALPEEVSAWDIDVRPDGAGLPSGSGSVATGGEIYDVQCGSCHGAFGEGEGRWPVLAGGMDTLTDERPEKTIGSYWPYLSTVYDYVKRAMPFGNARSLSDDDVYALTAYLLYLNDLVDEEFVLSDSNFASITLPNEENFFEDTRASEENYVLTGEPCMTDCKSGVATVTQRARVLDVTPDTE